MGQPTTRDQRVGSGGLDLDPRLRGHLTLRAQELGCDPARLDQERLLPHGQRLGRRIDHLMEDVEILLRLHRAAVPAQHVGKNGGVEELRHADVIGRIECA